MLRVDILDLKILSLLRANARVSYLSIGKTINLSPSAVIERVKKMEQAGVIKAYTTIIDGKAFDRELVALMFISLESPKLNQSFFDFVLAEDDILECQYITGNYDCTLKIITKNTTTLEHLLNKIKSQPGVSKTYTNVVLKTIKNEYSIAPSPLKK
jgi:Lrp/AsnC family leucine-responsive transcriptional regulator